MGKQFVAEEYTKKLCELRLATQIEMTKNEPYSLEEGLNYCFMKEYDDTKFNYKCVVLTKSGEEKIVPEKHCREMSENGSDIPDFSEEQNVTCTTVAINDPAETLQNCSFSIKAVPV